MGIVCGRNGLAEKAFDALYERIGITNNVRLEVFQGLDKKATESEFGRAVGHFEVRCRNSETFRKVAAECIDGGAYVDEPKTAVGKILEKSRRQ